MGKSKDRGGGGHKGTQSRGSNVEVEEREAGSGDEEDLEEMRNPLLDSLIDAVDKLSEKRSSTRVAGLASLVKILRSPGCSDEVMTSFNGYNETISPWLKKGLKATAPEKEGVLCAQLVALMALVQGEDDEDFVEEFAHPLDLVVRSGKDEDFRSWALIARTMLSFVCASEFGWSRKLLTFCEELFNFTDEFDGEPVSDALRVTAFNMWGVTAAYLNADDQVLERSKECVFTACLEALDGAADGAGVKIAAGETLALLWEVAERAHASGLVQQLGDGSTTVSKPSIFDEVFDEVEIGPREDAEVTANSVFGFAPEKEIEFTPANEARFVGDASTESLGGLLTDDFDEVDRAQYLIRQMTRDSSKKVSKKDRKEIRGEFRALDEWVTEGTAPTEVVKLAGGTIECKSFCEIKKLGLLRTVLADGLTSALRNYSVVCDMLEVEQSTLSDFADGDGERTVVNKGSMKAKGRTQALRRDRQARNEEISGYGSD
jgi:hypothetical protein